MFEKIIKYITLWNIGAFTYGIIEIIYRGNTHISMGIISGICFILIGNINKSYSFEIPVYKQMLYGAIIITCFEFATGVLVNIWLNLNVWDYSAVPLNICGQICFPFFIVWYLLSGFAIVLYNCVRCLIFKESKLSHYYIFSTQHI